MRNLRNVLILCAAALSLSGCAWFNPGPCYGVGCPSYVANKNAPSQTAQNTAAPKKAKHQKAPPPQNATVVEPPKTTTP